MALDVEGLLAKVAQISGQIVEEYTLEQLPGDASPRKFYRLRYGEGQSLVVMELGKAGQKQEALEELLRVWRYFWQQGLAVPQLYYYDSRTGMVLEEDLGGVTLQALVERQGVERCVEYYREAVELILRIQAAGRMQPDPECPALRRAFDEAKFMEELDFFVEYMVCGLLGVVLSPGERQELREEFGRVCRVLAAEPQVLTHRDFHSRNLLVREEIGVRGCGWRIRLVDFQDARLGPCQYDLVSLVRDAYVQLPEELVRELVEFYLERRKAQGMAVADRERFFWVFDLAALQRNLKAVGTFAYLALVRGLKGYLRYIPPTLGYVAATFAGRAELGGLHRLLGRLVLERVPADLGVEAV